MPTKTFKSDATSAAGVTVSKNNCRMHGNDENYVMAAENGITINGPVSFVSGTDQIRFGGLWVMNNTVQLSLPSTMATPSPVMMISPAVGQYASLMAEAGVMIALMTSMAAL